ncbi:MAG TPA: hypothetical protein VN724_09810 [Pyrinomonadaceae bacterium]|nr:hypothetical protein [Pyrinomonadaceae bacterium]
MDRSQAPSSGAIREVNYRLEIRPDALADIEAAATWYEEHEAGLGTDFVKTVLESIDSLLVNLLFTNCVTGDETFAGFSQIVFLTKSYIKAGISA